MNEFNLEALKQSIKDFKELVYETTNIFIGNPSDIININMYDIPSNCIFIGNQYINTGEMYKIEDSQLKRSLYEFANKYQDRVFRGKKEIWM